ILEHIALVENSAARVIRLLRRTDGRPPAREVKQGERGVDGGMLAPEVVSPKGEMNRDEVMQLLASARTAVLREVEESKQVLDVDGGFPHPFFGTMNALGWLRSLVWHEPHHIAQIGRVMSLEVGSSEVRR